MQSAAADILTVLAVMSLAVAPEYAVSHAAVANQRDSSQKDQAADGARFAFQKEANQVEYYEHDMGLHQCWVRWLRYQQHGQQALQAIHDEALFFCF